MIDVARAPKVTGIRKGLEETTEATPLAMEVRQSELRVSLCLKIAETSLNSHRMSGYQ